MVKNDEIFEIASMFRTFLKGISQVWNKRGYCLTLPQFKILYILDRDGPQRVSHLANSLHITPAAVIGVADQLLIEGYVRKERADNDRRVVNIFLTDKGKEMLSEMHISQQAAMGEYFNVLPEADIQHLKRIFTTLIESLEITN